MSITEYLIENMNQKRQLEEAMGYHTSQKDVREIVKELSENTWSSSKRAVREACKRIEELACSDKKIAQKFLKEMDKYSTSLGNKLMKETWDDLESDDGMSGDENNVNVKMAKFFVRNK